MGAGALRSTASNPANIAELTSNEFTYSTSPTLNAAPYILDNKLVATFNLGIELRDWAKVKVYKNPAGGNQEVNLKQGDIAVKNKNLLEITLPTVKAAEVYRLRLDAGAVNEEGKEANGNKVIAPINWDITIEAAPGLGSEPYLSGQKIIVPFNGPIRILNPAGIKYRFKASSGAGFSVAVKPNNEPKVISDNQLEIPLNTLPAGGQVYRIDLEAGHSAETKTSRLRMPFGPGTMTSPLLCHSNKRNTSR